MKNQKVEEIRVKSAEKGNENTLLSAKEQKEFDQIMKSAKEPVVLTDAEFKLGERELDVRNLSAKNYRQLMFRMEAHKVALLKGVHDDLVDVMRLNMLILKKLGVESITDELEALTVQINDEVKVEANKTEKAKS